MSSPTKSSSSSSQHKENIRVVVRCRPLSQDEKARGVPEHVVCDTEQSEVKVMIALGSKVGEKVCMRLGTTARTNAHPPKTTDLPL
jgi:hypothetical protein